MNPIFVLQTGRALKRLLERSVSMSATDMALRDEDVSHLFQTLEWSLQVDKLVADSAELIQRLHSFIESHGYAAYWIPLLQTAIAHPALSRSHQLLLQNQLCNAYRCREEYDLAIAAGCHALSQAGEVEGDDAHEISMRLHYNLALAYQESGQLDSAEYHLLHSQKIFEQTNSKHPFLTVNLPNLYGIINIDMGEYDKAHKLFSKARQLAIDTDQPQFLAWTTGNLGWANFRMKSYKDALKHYKDALSIATHQNDPAKMSLFSLSIGSTYIELNQLEMALQAFEEASTEQVRRFGTSSQKAMIATSIGHTYLLSKDIETAGHYLTQAVEIWRRTNNTSEFAYATGLLGMQEIAAGNELRGIKRIKESLALLEESKKAGLSLAFEHTEFFREELRAVQKNATHAAANAAA